MPNSKNIIYPEEKTVPERSRDKFVILVVIVILIIMGVFYAGSRRKPPPPPPPSQGDNTIQAGFFTVSQNPGRVAIQRGEVKPVEVKIVVLPLEGFVQSVAFAVDDILKEGRSVKEEGTLKAAFSPSKLEPKNFEKGTTLTITPTAGIGSGTYVINYRVQSESVKKDFRIAVTVQ